MIEKIKKYLSEHKAVLQFVKFTLISMIAGLSETATYLILNSWLLKPYNTTAHVFTDLAFLYPGTAGPFMGTFIALLVSSVVGQVISFVVNFKKTFNSVNNIVVSAVGYAIMAFLIVFGLNVYIGNLLTLVLVGAMPNYADIAAFIAKVICMMSSFFIVFPMNKFVIMREGKPEKEAETVSEPALEETAEAAENN